MDVQERAGRQRHGRPTDQKLTCELKSNRFFFLEKVVITDCFQEFFRS